MANNNIKNESGKSIQAFVADDMKAMLQQRRQARTREVDSAIYSAYQNEPREFIKKVLGENITDDANKVLLSVRDNVMTFAQSANAVGKTHVAARTAVWFYKCFPGAQVFTAAAPPEDNLKRLLWGEILSIYRRFSGSVFSGDKFSSNPLEIKRAEQEFIVGVTIPQTGDPNVKKARFSGKHAPSLLFILDECDAIPPEIFEAIESCMSGGHARFLGLFNPRSESGHVHNLQKLGRAHTVILSAFTHPNVITGRDVFPGAVIKEVTARRIHEWTRPVMTGERVDASVYYVPEYFDNYRPQKLNPGEDGKPAYYPPLKGGEMRKIIEPAFAYMVLGRYSPIAEDQLISRDWCEAALARGKAHRLRYGDRYLHAVLPKMGLDVAELGADTNVATIRYESYVMPQIEWGGVDIEDTSKEAIRLIIDWNISETYVDANGLGAGVYPKLRNAGYIAHRIMAQEAATKEVMLGEESIGLFYRVRDQGWWAMREWLRTDQTAMLPDGSDEPGGLIDQLCSARYGRFQGRIKICDNDVMKLSLGGKSPDKASSLMLTFCPENDESGARELVTSYYA